MTDEDEGDPFDRLAADADDRAGDPFEELSREDSESGTEQNERTDPTLPANVSPDPADGESSGDRAAETPDRSTPQGDEPEFEAGGVPGRETDPLGDLPPREGDPFEQGELFEPQETDRLDPERMWEELASSDAGAEDVAVPERTFADVSKHSYCEQCEHFSSPPDVACTNEGTDIVEFLDMETVRVVDCPVVAERRDLDGDS